MVRWISTWEAFSDDYKGRYYEVRGEQFQLVCQKTYLYPHWNISTDDGDDLGTVQFSDITESQTLEQAAESRLEKMLN